MGRRYKRGMPKQDASISQQQWSVVFVVGISQITVAQETHDYPTVPGHVRLDQFEQPR